MITRSAIRCLRRRPASRAWPRHRAYSSAAAAAPAAANASPNIALKSLVAELDKIAPRFDVDASQIRILETPSEFYETLKVAYRPIYAVLL